MSSRLVHGRSAHLNVMCKAVYKASRRLVRDFGEVENLQVSMKGPANFVSNADRQAEKTLYEELSYARPDYGFAMEESGVIEGKDPSYRWIIDPLDGTCNFLHGLPHFAISVAVEQDGAIIAGVTYDPIRDEMFTAAKGEGAFLNNRRIRVSSRQRMEESLLVTSLSIKNTPVFNDTVAKLGDLRSSIQAVRSFGATSLDLAYVAAGRFDVFWRRHSSIWDIAAGMILVKEAGGMVSELEVQAAEDKKTILASNAGLHQSFLRIFNEKKS